MARAALNSFPVVDQICDGLEAEPRLGAESSIQVKTVEFDALSHPQPQTALKTVRLSLGFALLRTDCSAEPRAKEKRFSAEPTAGGAKKSPV